MRYRSRSKSHKCCFLRGDDSDRTYLRCCSIRAWIRRRCSDGV